MLRTQSQLVAEYQDLLIGEESLASLERVTKLVWETLGGRVTPTDAGLAIEPSAPNASDLATKIRKLTSGQLALDPEPRQKLVLAQAGGTREQKRLRTLVIEVADALSLVPVIASQADFSGARYSLLMDSCILLAHHAYFALLPKLGGTALRKERAFLLTTFHQFADSLAEPANRYTLLALYFDAIDESRKAAESRRSALAATPADAHEFMTVLQDSWSSSVAAGMVDQALELLLDSYPRVPRRDLDEVGDMIRQTFRYGDAPTNGHSGPSGKSTRRKH